MNKKIPDIIGLPAIIALLSYLIWAYIATFLWGKNEYNLYDLNALALCVIAFSMILSIINNNRMLNIVISIWFLMGLVGAGLALCQVFFHGPYPAGVDEIALYKLSRVAMFLHAESVPIVVGFFNNQNKLAQILMPYFIVSSIFWINLLASKKRSLLWPVLSLSFGAILCLTFARSPIMISFVAIALFGFMKKDSIFNKIEYYLLSLIGFICIIGTPAALKIVGDSLSTRMSFLNVALNMFLREKLVFLSGNGMPLWANYFKEYAWWETFYPNAHNFYVNQLLLYGIIGLILMLLFIYFSLQAAFKQKNGSNRSELFSPFPYLAAAWAMLASAFFEPAFESLYQKFQLFFILAIIIAVSYFRIGEDG